MTSSQQRDLSERLQSRLPTNEGNSVIAAINLVLSVGESESVPECMSYVTGRWISRIDRCGLGTFSTTSAWREAVCLSVNTGRTQEAAKRDQIGEWSWSLLETVQSFADRFGLGRLWQQLCSERSWAATDAVRQLIWTLPQAHWRRSDSNVDAVTADGAAVAIAVAIAAMAASLAAADTLSAVTVVAGEVAATAIVAGVVRAAEEAVCAAQAAASDAAAVAAAAAMTAADVVAMAEATQSSSSDDQAVTAVAETVDAAGAIAVTAAIAAAVPVGISASVIEAAVDAATTARDALASIVAPDSWTAQDPTSFLVALAGQHRPMRRDSDDR